MNRGQLVDTVAKKNKISKTQADAVLASVIETIQGTVKKGQTVKLVGFGTFKKVVRKARLGVNPKTKAEIQIPRKTVPKFTASKTWSVK